MDTELMLDVGQANEIKLAARRAGATNADLKRLSEGDTFAKILPVLRGHANIVTIKHVIDLDADPFVPDGWRVEEHQRGGSFEWNPDEVSLFLTEEQSSGSYNEGNDLRKKLEGQNPFNANLLDYLLKHPDLIPEEWKGKWVFFWGTIYRYSDGHLFVRCLFWDVGEWYWRCYWLVSDFGGSDPSAVPART